MSQPPTSSWVNFHDELGLGGPEELSRQTGVSPQTLEEIQRLGFTLKPLPDETTPLIGKGTFCPVFHAVTTCGDSRAIKVYVTGQEHFCWFDSERQILSAKYFPNDFGPLYYTDCPGNDIVQPFIVMEYIRATPIDKYVRSKRRSFKKTAELLEQLSRGLQRLLDGPKWAHRDLHFENVVVERTGKVRVWDFGYAGPDAARSPTNMPPGNTLFTPPEIQRKEEQAKFIDDVFSICAIGCMLFTEENFYKDDEVKGKKIQSGDPELLGRCKKRLSDAGVPPALNKILVKGLLDRDNRHRNFGSLADELHRWRVPQHNRLLAMLAVMFVCFVAAGLALFAQQAMQKSARQEYEQIGSVAAALTNANHAAVRDLMDRAEKLSAENDPESLREATRLLETAVKVDNGLDQKRQLGSRLNTGAWVTESQWILDRTVKLQKRYKRVVQLLDDGKPGEATPILVELEEGIGELEKQNILATNALAARERFDLLHKAAPLRLRQNKQFIALATNARDASAFFANGGFNEATMSYGRHEQEFRKWLEKNETPDERQDRERLERTAAPKRDAADAEARMLLPDRQADPPDEINSIGMEFFTIPAGRFEMGSQFSNNEDDDKPHEVEITRPFQIGKNEVTQQQYVRIMPATRERHEGDGNLPVIRISWYDAVKWCNALSRHEGLSPIYHVTDERDEDKNHSIESARVVLLSPVTKPGYRLPTEAEWEYAARAGTKTKWFFGNDEKRLGAYAWHKANSAGARKLVASRLPNGFGLYDMAGGVTEWCHDWYGRSYYRKSVRTDPTGPDHGVSRVVRGGSYHSEAGATRSAYRQGIAPDGRVKVEERNVGEKMYMLITIGFRVCRTVTEHERSRNR